MGRYSYLIVLLVSVQAIAKEIGRFVKSSEAHSHDNLQSRMREVEASVDVSGKFATVKFLHEGHHHHYSLTSHSIYSDAAQIFEGGTRIDTPLGRTFRSREQGRWASMTVHTDGKITGLFEHKGVMIEIQPVAHQEQQIAKVLLANFTGKHPAHLIKNVVLEEVLDATRMSRRLLTKPTVDQENPAGKGNNNIPSIAPNVVPTAAQAVSSWGGVPWFPGCYSGDNKQHIFEIGVTSDQAALDMHQNDLSSKLESIVNDASLVYEHQMNIKLQIGYSKQMGSSYGACPTPDDNICTKRLDQTKAFITDGTLGFQGAVHHFTGCGKTWGVMGLAYVGTICDQSAYNCGSNKLAGSSPWLTFAHELGHNFNGKHSFENGQGSTGGIMDYGDGKLNGHFQFNTGFRKTAMCSTMNHYVNNCPSSASSKFRVAPALTPAATTTVAAATTPAATTAPVPTHIYHLIVHLINLSNLWWVSDHYAEFALDLAQSIADAFGIDINRVHIQNNWGGRRLAGGPKTGDLNINVDIDDNQGDVTPGTTANNIGKVAPLLNNKLAPKHVTVGGATVDNVGTTTPQITVTATPPVGGLSAKYASLGKSGVHQVADETQFQPTPLLMCAICLLLIGVVVGVVKRVVKRESHIPIEAAEDSEGTFLE